MALTWHCYKNNSNGKQYVRFKTESIRTHGGVDRCPWLSQFEASKYRLQVLNRKMFGS